MKFLSNVSAVMAIAAAIGLVATPAYADLTNIRPVFIDETGGEDTLQDIFDEIYVSGPGIDADVDQTIFGLFTSQGAGGAIATFIIEIAGNAGSNTFGLYSFDDTSNRAQVFAGGDSAGSTATVTFFANGDIEVDGVNVATGFATTWGFYMAGNGGTFFTLDSDNSVEAAQALTYQGDGLTTIQIDPFVAGLFGVDEFIIAWEDIPLSGSDHDYNDMVIIVESLTPIPLPGAALLGVLGLGMVGWLRRKFA